MSFSQLVHSAVEKVVFSYIDTVVNKYDLNSDELYRLWGEKCEAIYETKTQKSSPKKDVPTSNEADVDDLSPKRLSGASKKELQALCRYHGYKVTGNKDILKNRLLGKDPDGKSRKSSVASVKKSKKQTPPPEQKEIVKKVQAQIPSVSVRRNEHGNFVHPESGLLFDRDSQKIVGRQLDDGTIIKQLTDEDIQVCKRFKFAYDLPQNLDKNTLDKYEAIEVAEMTDDEESIIEEPMEEVIEERPIEETMPTVPVKEFTQTCEETCDLTSLNLERESYVLRIEIIGEAAKNIPTNLTQKYPAVEGEEFLPVIKIRELRNGISDRTDKANLDIPENYLIENGDVLFSWSGTLEVEICSACHPFYTGKGKIVDKLGQVQKFKERLAKKKPVSKKAVPKKPAAAKSSGVAKPASANPRRTKPAAVKVARVVPGRLRGVQETLLNPLPAAASSGAMYCASALNGPSLPLASPPTSRHTTSQRLVMT